MRIFLMSTLLMVVFCMTSPVISKFYFEGPDSRLRIVDPHAKLVLNSPIMGFNGTLEITDSITGQLVGRPIVFSSGIIARNGASATWSGMFDASNNGRVALQGSSQLRAQPGMVFDGLHVSGLDNLVEGTPKFSQPIVLADPLAELKFSIQNKLNHDVHINGGKVRLEDTLSIGDDVMLHGTGIVDINSHTFHFPGKASVWGGSLSFLNATDMTLNAALTLTGDWYFGPDNSIAVFQGNGNVLDLSGGGRLIVQPGVGLEITDVVIKGLSDSQLCQIVLCDSNSTLTLSNVVLQLADSYTFTQGNIYFYGANSMIVTGQNVLTIGGTAVATIDATTVEYDTLGLLDLKPISPIVPDDLRLRAVNNGRLMSRPSGTSFGVVLTVTNSFYQQVTNEFLDPHNRSLYIHPRGDSCTWDGGGYSLDFSTIAGYALSIGNANTLTLQNIVLKNFSSSKVQLLGFGTPAEAKLIFGDGVRIELSVDEDLSMTWSFTGQTTPAVINGNGKSINLAALPAGNNVGISVGAGQGGSPVMLTIQDAHILGLSGGVAQDTLVASAYTYSTQGAYVASSNRIRCVDSTGIINFKNSDLNLTGNYTLTAGSINIYNDVAVRGAGYTFAFSSNGTLAIKSASTLFVDRNVTFSYDSSGLGNAGGRASKNQLTMADLTSRLYLNGCTFYGTHTSPALQTGIVVINDKVKLQSEGTVDAEAMVFNSTSGLRIEVLSGAIMDVYGAVAHQ